MTGWFDSGGGSEPYTATVRFTGRRVGVVGKPQARDTFVRDERIEGILPGTGPVAISTWVYGLEPGDWTVGAELIGGHGEVRSSSRARGDGMHPVRPASWSWRHWSVSTAPDEPIRTRWALIAPLARIPAVAPGLYTILAVLGAIVALAVQAIILSGQRIDAGAALMVSLLALVSGLIGAKAWYAILHPKESVIRGGWAVDGFLVVAPVVATLGLLAVDLPIGRVLDATTPGLFFAVALGRVGCLLAGCCAGRCTAARWGVWSSDRRVGARRIPTQLLESAAGLAIGLVALLIVASTDVAIHGAVFILAFAAYAAIRQVLLRLRAERRSWSGSVTLAAGAAVVVLFLVAVMSLVQVATTPSFG